MKLSQAGGLKTRSDAARPAFGNALEEKIETVLAAMTKGVDHSVSSATGLGYNDERRQELETAARLGSACAALVSAAARLNGEFKHNIEVRHSYEVEDEDEEANPRNYNPDVPLFTREELQSFDHVELMREIAIRQAAYWARKAAELRAATAGIPAPLRAQSALTRADFAPATVHAGSFAADNDDEAPAEAGSAEDLADIARSLDALEDQIDALEALREDAPDEEMEDDDLDEDEGGEED